MSCNSESGARRPGSLVEVRRSGGFAGLMLEGSLDVDGDDSRAAEARSLVARIDLRTARSGLPHPDGYVYEFCWAGTCVSVPEQHVTDDLRRLATIVLEDGPG